MKEALLYEKLDSKVVRCKLCSHRCRIDNQKFGFCGVRENVDGLLYTHAYGNVAAACADPIEKKPLYHFLPGTNSFSISTIGCNFRCGFCQNWEISQKSFKSGVDLDEEEFLPSDIVDEALRSDCKSISYTYTEPTIFFEYAYETAKLAKERGLANIFVTNGYMTSECLDMLDGYLDAANVDLKFFNEDAYRRVCAGSLKPVLDSIRKMKDMGVWVEVTTLMIPGENDSRQELSAIAEFIASVDKNMPWHISRFHPDYKFKDYSVTPEKALKEAQNIALQSGLNFVYVGNVSGWGNDTFCPDCKKKLIGRQVFNIMEYHIKEGKCLYCRNNIPGIFLI
jgi:pyruvate formate lyase activating enzyme